MSFLSSLHGPLALLVLCGLIFIEEAGVPLPLLPGDLLLVAGGVLVANHTFHPVLFFLLVVLASVAGAMTGYAWSRRVGLPAITGLARRLRATAHLERATRRLRKAGPVAVMVARLIPGLRVYVNLVCGAVRMPPQTFVAGAAASAAIWCGVFGGLGIAVGLPLQGWLHSFDAVLLDGVLCAVVGLGAYVLIRRIPSRTGRAEALALVRRPWRAAAAAAVDLLTVGSALVGLYTVAQVLFHLHPIDGWADALITLTVMAAAYLLLTRGGTGVTAGEALTGASYRRLQSHPDRAAPRGDSEGT